MRMTPISAHDSVAVRADPKHVTLLNNGQQQVAVRGLEAISRTVLSN